MRALAELVADLDQLMRVSEDACLRVIHPGKKQAILAENGLQPGINSGDSEGLFCGSIPVARIILASVLPFRSRIIRPGPEECSATFWADKRVRKADVQRVGRHRHLRRG